MDREQKVLERHFRHWREKELITPALEEQLRQASARLRSSAAGAVVRNALAFLAGGLVLAGLTLIIAENWELLHRFVKLGGWSVLQAAFVLGAWYLGRRFADRPALAEALTLVAGGWVLAGIALVSQIYNLDARPPNGIWLWLVLVLPAAWLLARKATAVVVFVALVTALALETAEPGSWLHAQSADGPWLCLALPLFAAGVVSFLPHRAPALADWVGAWTFAASQFCLLVLGAGQDLDHSDLGRAWVIVAAGLAAGLFLTERVLPRGWGGWTARGALVLSLVPWMLMGAQYDGDLVFDRLAVGVAWIVQLLVPILIVRAAARGGSRLWVNLGYLALAIGVITRYFDFFGDYLEGGAALALTGLLLLVAVFGLERARRRTLAQEVTQ